MAPRREKAKTAAVVGTGLAGLVAAFLLQRKGDYEVEVFENGPRASLDAASVSISIKQDEGITHERVDVPMRAFSQGYYPNLKAMYDFIGVRYRRQRMLFAFSEIIGPDLMAGAEHTSSTHFIHASNSHIFPPIRPQNMSIGAYLLELGIVGFCYLWFILCCSIFSPLDDEALGAYLERVRVPGYFTNRYILPLISAISTCSHDELLLFPAHDLVNYRRRILGGEQFIVTNGIRDVQNRLLRGLTVHFDSEVLLVEPERTRVKVTWCGTADGRSRSRHFDEVILAVPPDVVARVFAPSTTMLSRLTTTAVKTVVHSDSSSNRRHDTQGWLRHTGGTGDSQMIHLRTSLQDGRRTEATHAHRSGTMITTSPLRKIERSAIRSEHTFTRVLRTVESRCITHKVLGMGKRLRGSRTKNNWENGECGVWVVGAWCWDGMVLLEGCVVSAMRVARALGVDVPWTAG